MSQASPTSTVSQTEQQAATLPQQQQGQTLERNQSSTSSDPALDDGGDDSLLTLRALLSSKEAGAVIGKGIKEGWDGSWQQQQYQHGHFFRR